MVYYRGMREECCRNCGEWMGDSSTMFCPECADYMEDALEQLYPDVAPENRWDMLP